MTIVLLVLLAVAVLVVVPMEVGRYLRLKRQRRIRPVAVMESGHSHLRARKQTAQSPGTERKSVRGSE